MQSPLRIIAVTVSLIVAATAGHAQTKTAPARAAELPTEMLGSWAREAEDCTDSQSEGRLHISRKTLEFFENKLTISRVTSLRDGWLHIEGMSLDAGKKKPRPAKLDLRLRDNDKLLLRNGPGQSEDFVRCKPALLQG